MSAGSYFCSTVGRKQVMALAGIALCGFVLMHALGNLFMFVGPEAYNKYGHAIVSNPLIYLAEGGLVFFFLAHIVSGVTLTIRNFAARPEGYAKAAKGDKSTSLTTKTMWIQGLVILGFVVLHLITFKYGPHYEVTVDGQGLRDLFRLVFEVFQSPVYVGGYIFALLILCFHLSHGLYSSLQTLGLHHPKYTQKLKCASVAYGVFVSAAFISQPIYMFFIYKG
jgi:succinate dehydrogenase / fumarate reductase, cytochrome b subunit